MNLFKLPENRNSLDLSYLPPEINFVLKLLDCLRVVTDGHHRYEAIRELRKDLNPMYDWTWEPFAVILTIQAHGWAL